MSDYDQTPDFIYGGPFIHTLKNDPILDAITPINLQLSAIFKRSFAYHTVRERLPVIVTKVIDLLSREQNRIKGECGANDGDIRTAIQHCTQLKNDIVTNKKMSLFTVDTENAKNWNKWIEKQEKPYYFTSVWIFTECYVYRKLREAFETSGNLIRYDPFRDQKDEAFHQNVEAMCVVSDKLESMAEGEKEKTKPDLVTLLKLALWANKCDLSLSAGESVAAIADPFGCIITNKDKVLVDDSGKVADFIINKSEALNKQIQEEKKDDEEANIEDDEEQKPCPSKATLPPCVMVDIVCDNAGYELFTDLCIGHFLLAKNIVQKVRFHVKDIPWFVSDVTPRDFQWVIDSCASAKFQKDYPVPEKPAPGPDEEPVEEEKPEPLTSEKLNELGGKFQEYVTEGQFVLMSDSFWTSPHVYKDMKAMDPLMYRKLQFALCVIFKGDLNYRKLLGERNWNPTTSFEKSLEGFLPTQLAAIRTVKADLISGLPKNKWETLRGIDDKWMEKGDYGVIQFCAKGDPRKASDRPCEFYGNECKGKSCEKKE